MKIIKDLIAAYKLVKEQKEKVRIDNVCDERIKFELIEKEHNNLINKFREQYLSEVKSLFLKNNKPLFKVGEIAVTNWYGPGDSWEGSIKMSQKHTPYRGPIDVIIKDICVDYSELSENIYNMNESHLFDEIKVTDDYDKFKDLVNQKCKNSLICVRNPFIYFGYKILVYGDDHEYWRYYLRQHKFLKKNSELAKWSKRAFANQLKSEKLIEEKIRIDEKVKKLIEEIETKNRLVQ